jgi:hypothetical protein
MKDTASEIERSALITEKVAIASRLGVLSRAIKDAFAIKHNYIKGKEIKRSAYFALVKERADLVERYTQVEFELRQLNAAGHGGSPNSRASRLQREFFHRAKDILSDEQFEDIIQAAKIAIENRGEK